MSKLTNHKATLYPSILKIQEADRPFMYGHKNHSKKKKKDKNPELKDPETSARKSRARIRSIIYANAFQYKDGDHIIPAMFSTLTFAENIKNTTLTHKKYRNFIKRLSYKTGRKIEYIAVFEYQKRGAVHYHVIFFNLPYIEDIHKVLTECWGEGFVLNKTIMDVDHLINYISKYIQKEINTKHIKHRKRFLTSNGLLKPTVVRDPEVIKELLNLMPINYIYKECEYITQDGVKFKQSEFHFPPGTNLNTLLKNTKTDTAEYIEEYFKFEE